MTEQINMYWHFGQQFHLGFFLVGYLNYISTTKKASGADKPVSRLDTFVFSSRNYIFKRMSHPTWIISNYFLSFILFLSVRYLKGLWVSESHISPMQLYWLIMNLCLTLSKQSNVFRVLQMNMVEMLWMKWYQERSGQSFPSTLINLAAIFIQSD